MRRILHDPVGRTPRDICSIFRAKNRRPDLPLFDIEQNLATKLDPTLKPNSLKEITYLIFTHSSLNVHAVCER